MKLSFVFYAALEIPLPMAAFFVSIDIFRFWPNTIDYCHEPSGYNNNNMRALQHSDTICTSERRNGK